MTNPPSPPQADPSAQSPASDPSLRDTSRRLSLTEGLAAILFVVIADWTIYHGSGFAGWAALVAATPLLLLMAASERRLSWVAVLFGFGLLLISAKLLWVGTSGLAFAGVVVTLAFAMELSGIAAWVPAIPLFAGHLVVAGFLRLKDYFEAGENIRCLPKSSKVLQVVLPLAVVAGFSVLFTLANPDVAQAVGTWLTEIVRVFSDWISQISLRWSEIVFWLAMAWLFVGMARPVMAKTIVQTPPDQSSDETPRLEERFESALYPAFANTLAAVIVLFVIYLGFEFSTLWFRKFPEGFHYSGYAHEGAAWLTVALALATLVLSAIFRGETLLDHRLPRLRRLAWIWSALNLLLAIAVYHRLLIYVDFNGMTRMRTIGFLGITSVVVGFALVVEKIVRQRRFFWLVQRQLWVVATAALFYLVMPVDALVHHYNVKRILAGDPAPSVQISVHPLDSGGMMELIPLLNSDNPIIRDGVRAMLAEKARELEKTLKNRETKGWTSFQWADWVLHERLEAARPLWDVYENSQDRRAAQTAFSNYAYQWY